MKHHIVFLRLANLMILIACLAMGDVTFGATLTGQVSDKKSGLPIGGANVVLMETSRGTATDQSGHFRIADLLEGSYMLAVSYIGYHVEKRLLKVTDMDIDLAIELSPTILKGQEITISASRAVLRETPVAFTDITRQELGQKLWSQEIPLLLSEVPGVYAYSYSGGGLGYSEVKIRGFDATRVGVTINDVPLNDPEDHVTYFYDLPEISSNIQDIQVQRGVANSLYGTAALAGSVNLQTIASGQERYIQYSSGLGSFNTQKHSFVLSSGLVDNTYSFYGRFSKIHSDGYRENAWVNSWSYYFAAVRYDRNLTTRIHLFGGPMRAHFAWQGITREELRKNRRTNYDSYPDAADNFNQPHYQFIQEWTPRENFRVISTLFHIKGDGYYEIYNTALPLSNFNLTDSDGEDRLSDLVWQEVVSKKQFGWIPRIEWEGSRFKLSTGGEFYLFNADHWGKVIWGSYLPVGTIPGHRFYDHNVNKRSAAVYVNNRFDLARNLSLKLDLQFLYLKTHLDQKKMGAFYGHDFSMVYRFLTPRLGMNLNLNASTNIFFNFSTAKRQPKDADIYKANDPYAVPLFKYIDLENSIYKRPYVKPESLRDFETGISWQTPHHALRLNGYYMIFDNEIVATGGITFDGYPIYGNAEKSIHRGIEAEFRATVLKHTELSCNATVSDNYFKRYQEYLWNRDYTGHVAFDQSGHKISNFPGVMLNGGIVQKIGPARISFKSQHIGRIFVDNSQSLHLSIAPRTVHDLSFHFALPDWFRPLDLEVAFFVNNLLNRKYELTGYVWEGVGYYIPAAERNFFLTLNLAL